MKPNPINLPHKTPIDLVSLRFFNRTLPRLEKMLEVLEDELFVIHIMEGGSHKDYKKAILKHPKYLSLVAAINEVSSKRKMCLRQRVGKARAETPHIIVDLDWSENVLFWADTFNQNYKEILFRIHQKNVLPHEEDQEETE
jgi:hypothetical protein